ncbi:MAG: carbamoyltransferase C-terminal domain-containing protein [Pseudomonadota bacterium]
MIVLGISDSHEAHACIVRDGTVVAAIAEERLSRLKADTGYPRRSIDAVLAMAGVEPHQIDRVAFAGAKGSALQIINKLNATFSVQDWVAQNRKYWGPRLIDGAPLTAFDDFEMFKHVRGDDLANDPYLPFVERARNADPSTHHKIFNDLRREVVCGHLGIDPSAVCFYRHEDCHKVYGLFSAPERLDEALVLTMEGGGDDSSATVSVFDNNRFEEKWSSNTVNAGRLYRLVTLLLGMKPGQHEYKVMGLAPYGTEYHGRRSLEFFRTLHKLRGIEILDTKTVPDLYISVRDALEGERFDGIAWALQTWLEELLCDWTEACLKEFGDRPVVLSGGVAQNIKACKALIDRPFVGQLWSGPIAGDGSLGIGAAWIATREMAPDLPLGLLETVYLGTEYGADVVARAVENSGVARDFTVKAKPSAADAARWLEEGKIVARYSGRMEFGQRALGNRSILADPRFPESVDHINRKIKYRDFWMPFTPSMRIEDAQEYLVNPKNIYSPFMTMAFDVKPQYVKSLSAAIHPADKTARPQMLKREINPGYYDLITAFKDRTGVGAVLNTSFNLHGDAIVETPDDAIDTFRRSELDVLLFDDVAVARADLG